MVFFTLFEPVLGPGSSLALGGGVRSLRVWPEQLLFGGGADGDAFAEGFGDRFRD